MALVIRDSCVFRCTLSKNFRTIMKIFNTKNLSAIVAATMSACTIAQQEADNQSLVPQTPSTAPDYYCTWNLQGYVTSYVGGRGSNDLRIEMHEDNLFGGDYNYKVWGENQPKTTMNNAEPPQEVTWTVDTRYQGWLNHYPQIREDLIFVIDDSWDIPKGPGPEGASKRPHGVNYDNEYLARIAIDEERFPSFQGTDEERLAQITKAVRKKGWRGMGGWICAQDPINFTKEYTGKENDRENSLQWSDNEEEKYWKMRLEESERAGFWYWKVDWGNKDRNEHFRRNLSKWSREVAPHVIIEHASFQDGGTHHPDYIAFSQTIRSYDVNNNIAQAQTIQRLKELGEQPSAEINGWSIINCEDEPYIAAGLGCAIGVMRHPYVGAMPDGTPDRYFADYGPQSRRLKNRLNEVVRAVRWHRIALPFSHDKTQWHSDNEFLGESGNGRTWEAPARVSRRLPLPEFIGEEATDTLRPYLLASLYDNGCAALSIINRNIDGIYQQQRPSVSFQPKSWEKEVGIFGYCNKLIINYQDGLPEKSFVVVAQDLAADAPIEIPYKITDDGKGIIVDGKNLEEICRGHEYPYTEVEREEGKDYTDVSDPGVVLVVRLRDK